MSNMEPLLIPPPSGRKKTRKVFVDNRKMERLSQALELQQRALKYIVRQQLTPFRQEMASCPKPTLAQLAKELRLTRLVDVLQGSLEAERHLTTWFNGLKSPLEQDIENELERTLQTIEGANVAIRKEWTVRKEEKENENNSNSNRPLSDKGQKNKSTFSRQPSLRRISYDLDTSIFHEDDDDEEKRDILEKKIACLHKSLYRIILALKQLIEVICDRVTGSPDSLKLGVTGSDMYLLMMKFPQTYVLSEEDDMQNRRNGRMTIGRCGSIEIHNY